jgi:hypothetical protein
VMRMSKRRLDALIKVASRGIDEIEADLDNCGDDERAEITRRVEDSTEAFRYLVEWRKSMDRPKQIKPRQSREQMIAEAMNRAGEILASPGIKEIIEG